MNLYDQTMATAFEDEISKIAGPSVAAYETASISPEQREAAVRAYSARRAKDTPPDIGEWSRSGAKGGAIGLGLAGGLAGGLLSRRPIPGALMGAGIGGLAGAGLGYLHGGSQARAEHADINRAAMIDSGEMHPAEYIAQQADKRQRRDRYRAQMRDDLLRARARSDMYRTGGQMQGQFNQNFGNPGPGAGY